MEELRSDAIRAAVRKAYGRIALAKVGSGGSATGGCGCGCGSAAGPHSGTAPCCGAAPSAAGDSRALGYSGDDLAAVPEGADLGLGCGNPQIPAQLRPGEIVVDLGSGAGFDAFLAARRVGETGRVIGVDMTAEMVEKARATAAAGGYGNVEFRLGEIEALPLADAAADVIISNCVVNLSPDKEKVFAEAYRVLKAGGRLAISDIVSMTPLPEAAKADLALHASCIAGASTQAELETLLKASGFVDIDIHPKGESKMFIQDWAPGMDASAYVLSALITARKPRSGDQDQD